MIRLANFEKHLKGAIPAETFKHYMNQGLPEPLAAELRFHRQVQDFSFDGDAPTGNEACDGAVDDAYKMVTRACRQRVSDGLT